MPSITPKARGKSIREDRSKRENRTYVRENIARTYVSYTRRDMIIYIHRKEEKMYVVHVEGKKGRELYII